MRVELKELMEKLGVDYILSAYETRPWFLYDAEKGITCSAEVRMGPGEEDVQAEIQFLHDEKEGEEDKGSGSSGGLSSHGRLQQILHMRVIPTREGKWNPVFLTINGESYVNEVHSWEEKGCNFFRSCIEAIQMNELPDIEKLIDTEMYDSGRAGGGKRGRVGRKAPKIKPGQLLGMKR
ncbi:MAG: hypothetical protein IPH06_05240 [Alphaproteobacteria bacterium]|jgi:hypothetical protein|nr:hypothetical protein [Alphaproteobacteria bacterium]QQS57428.1 MAG: hypothetical protein IPN28_01005 [Alphaproteobacteria bacterium]